MVTPGYLRERDLRALTSVIEDGLRDDPGDAMPWAVLDRLLQLIPCDLVQFSELDVPGCRTVTGQVVMEGGERLTGFGADVDDDPRYWALREKFLPVAYLARREGAVSVLRWSDFYSPAKLRNAPFYAQYRDPSLTCCILVSLPAGQGRTRRAGFFRSEPDFTEEDRLALHLLRPHLHEVYLDAERRRHGTPSLTPREGEVLNLASQGCSNADIARVLVVSVSTVRKHMEHIFDRTGVRNREAAVALALPPCSGFQGPPAQRKRSPDPAD